MNYYEQVLKDIEEAIRLKNYDQALTLLDEELSMPFIPQAFEKKFIELRRQVDRKNARVHAYLDNWEDIELALYERPELQYQALTSLSRLNLRIYLEEIQNLLMDEKLSQDIKKQILLFLMHQDIDVDLSLLWDNEWIDLKVKDLTHPLEYSEYARDIHYLKEHLGSKNPSLFEICMEEYHYQLIQAFPFNYEEVNVEQILKQVLSNFSQN